MWYWGLFCVTTFSRHLRSVVESVSKEKNIILKKFESKMNYYDEEKSYDAISALEKSLSSLSTNLKKSENTANKISNVLTSFDEQFTELETSLKNMGDAAGKLELECNSSANSILFQANIAHFSSFLKIKKKNT